MFKSLCFAFLLVLLAALTWRLHNAGLFEVGHDYGQSLALPFSNCSNIRSDAIGPEDVAVISTSPPLLLISSAPRLTMVGSKIGPGNIYLTNLEDRSVTRVPLVGFEEVFHPHGISIFKTGDGRILLFTVNHRNAGQSDQVVIFEYNSENNQLIHKETVQDKLFISLNDIVAVGEREFYVTNDKGVPRWSLFAPIVTVISQVSLSSVVYWDGNSVTYAAGQYFKMANGIAQSNDRKYIYVTDTLAHTVTMFEITDKSHGYKLKVIRIVNVHTGVDNIDVDTNEDLWIGCHQNLIRFLMHAVFSEASGPSQAIKVSLHDLKKPPTYETVYSSNGNKQPDVQASSTAVHIGKYLVVSPVFEPKLLICE